MDNAIYCLKQAKHDTFKTTEESLGTFKVKKISKTTKHTTGIQPYYVASDSKEPETGKSTRDTRRERERERERERLI